MKYPGTRGFFGRKELKRLKQTTLATYFQFLADYNIPEKQRWVYNSQDSIIRFENGSQIYLLDLANQPSDPLYQRFWSLEFTDGFIDESAEVDPECINILYTRIGRQKNDEYWLCPKMLETFNPDKGHVYRDFWLPYKKINQWDEGNWTIEHPGFDGEVVKRNWCFIPAVATDNKKLARSYIDNLLSASEMTRQRLLFGNFDYDDTPGRLFHYDAICALWDNARILSSDHYISCDAARKGKDSATIFVWHGLHIVDIIVFAKCDNKELRMEIQKQMVLHQVPVRNVIVDEDGVWWGLVDEIGCKWFINNAKPISPLSASKNDLKRKNYQNLKTQCYFLLGDYVNASQISIARWLYVDEITQELDVIVEIDLDKDGKKRILSKDDVKMKLWRSPDYSDGMMMRMYFELRKQWPEWETIQGNHDVITQVKEPDWFGESPDEFEERMMSEVQEVSLNPY